MKIAFVGGGHMTQALVAGLRCSDVAVQVVVADKNASKRQALAADYGVETVQRLPQDLQADALVLAVRPPQALAVARKLPAAGALLSVVAGLRCAALCEASGRDAAQVARAMPNMPAQVGLGMTWLFGAGGLAAGARAASEAVFGAAGRFAWVAEEGLLDAGTAVSGSAPAYVYYFIEAMQEGAARLGLDDAAAQQAILQTLRGACAMVEKNVDKTPAQLCAAVAVPGGTTARALAIMQDAGMKETIVAAIEACAARAREMGDG